MLDPHRSQHPSIFAQASLSGGTLPPARDITVDDPGDVLYGAKAIARFLFGSDDRRATRRVFNLWTFYQHRKDSAGLFKLKGALCLSKTRWRAFRG